jgi:oligoribonuclease NrnB/cAMP/cGMP phosphodiesterase (DHH superfamily)
MKPLCIYHGNCADGFAAAWVVNRFFKGEVDFHPAIYGQEPPDVAGRVVIMVDFSYKRPVLEAMAPPADSIIILDHHKTAHEDLIAFDVSDREDGPVTWLKAHDILNWDKNVIALFDMERSGATMTWDFFYPDTPRPRLLNHIEDRDLWLFKLEGTREIQANVVSYPHDFEVWDRLMSMDCADLIAEGRAIERKHFKDIGELVAVTKRTMIIGGFAVPVANLPYTLASDAGNKLAQHERFAATYYDVPGARVFSLRSAGDEGLDVSVIAKMYGGGGHKNAAGFRAPAGWEGDV